jgi:hypothetical protein
MQSETKEGVLFRIHEGQFPLHISNPKNLLLLIS